MKHTAFLIAVLMHLVSSQSFAVNLKASTDSLETRYIIQNFHIVSIQNDCKILLCFDLLDETELTIRVFNETGQDIYCYKDFYAAGRHTHSIIKVPSGSYTIWIETPTDRLIRRITIQ